MDSNKIKLYIPNDCITNMHLNGLDLTIHLFLNHLVYWNFSKDRYYVSPKFLAYQIYGGKDISDSVIGRIHESLRKMTEYGFIEGYKNGNGFILDCNQFGQYESNFTTIDYNELSTILKSNNNCKFELVKMYLIIKNRLKIKVEHNGTVAYVCRMPQTAFCSTTVISKKTFNKYITCLENLKLISVYRSDIPNGTNVYGLYKDAEFVKLYALKFYTPRLRSETNEHRSLMAKYNWLLKGKTYSESELKEIKDYVKYHNSKMRDLQQQFPNDDYSDKIKDLSIFDTLLIEQTST